MGSVLKYACEAWGWGDHSIIDRFDAKILRRACGVGATVSATAVRWLFGRLSVTADIWKQSYKFWYKISSMGAERFEHVAMRASWVLFREYGTGWVSEMLSVFRRIGFVCENEDSLPLQGWSPAVINAKFVIFSQLVDEYWVQKMRQDMLAANSKYDFLLLTHPAFGAADVIKATWRWDLRRFLCKFLLCDHGLEIERGRRGAARIHKEERFCTFCSKLGGRNVGDERHVLDVCLQYEKQRVQILDCIQKSGVDINNHGSSIFLVLTELDQYRITTRMKVWQAMASFAKAIMERLPSISK